MAACLALGFGAVAPWVATRAAMGFPEAARVEITPAEGPSWLHQIGLVVDETCFGQAGAWVSPPVVSVLPHWDGAPDGSIDGASVVLTGSDLYRFNCQACHKADGAGIPPVIPSLIGPVRAASPAGFREQMKARGYEMDAASIRELTSQSERAFRERLRLGGERMPSFPHLKTVEVDAMLAYLKLLAGVRGQESLPIPSTEPALRVGEHLVKGTCHLCHDATGPGRDEPLELSMMRGVIPSLASIPLQRTKAEVIRKVRLGLAEPLPYMTRGRMPVLGYFSGDEIAAAYEYLTTHQPR